MASFGLGIQFCLTDEESITYYLKDMVKNQLLRLEWKRVMIERNIYGEKGTPWDLFCNNDPWQIVVDPLGKIFRDQKVLYVFTRLSSIGKKKGDKNKNRTAGCGQWHGNTAAEPIKKAGIGELIGKKRTFTFKAKEETQGQWTMYEYYIDGDCLEGLNNELDTSLVLCRMKRDDSKSSKGGKLVSRSRYGIVESNDQGLTKSAKRKSDIDQFGSTKNLRTNPTDSPDVQALMISDSSANDCSDWSTSMVLSTSIPPAASNMNNEEPDIAGSNGAIVDAALGDIVYDPSNFNVLPIEDDPNGWITMEELDPNWIPANDSSTIDGEQINGPIQAN